MQRSPNDYFEKGQPFLLVTPLENLNEFDLVVNSSPRVVKFQCGVLIMQNMLSCLRSKHENIVLNVLIPITSNT